MSIPSQLPVMTIGAKPVSLQALSLRPSQTVTGVWCWAWAAMAPRRSQVGRQTLNLNMPKHVPTRYYLDLAGAGQRGRTAAGAGPAAPPGTQSVAIRPSPPPCRRRRHRSSLPSPARCRPWRCARARRSPDGARAGAGRTTQIQAPRPAAQCRCRCPSPPGTMLTLQAQGRRRRSVWSWCSNSQPAAQPAVPQRSTSRCRPKRNMPSSARTALTQMVQTAVARQDSMGGLTAALSSALGKRRHAGGRLAGRASRCCRCRCPDGAER